MRRHARPGGRRADRAPLPEGFGILWTTVALDLLGWGIILPILPLYAERFAASPVSVGLLVAAFSLAQLVCAPLLGRLSDRIGRKPVLLISLFGTAAGSFVTAGAWALWVLFAGRVIDGASGASVSVAQGAVADITEPAERPRLYGLLGAAFGVGFVLGPALGGLAALAGPRVPFVVAGVIAAVNGLVALRRLPETRPVGPANLRRIAGGTAEKAQVGKVWRQPGLLRLAVVAFVALAAFAAFEATFALLGQDRFGLTEGSVAAVFVFVGLLLVAVQGGAIRPVEERLGVLRTLRTGLALDAAGLVVLAVATSWPALVVALVLLVCGQGLVTPMLTSAVSERAEEATRGEALGFQQSAGALARVVGPALAGVLYGKVGIPAPYLVGAAAVGIALLLALRLAPATPAPAPVAV